MLKHSVIRDVGYLERDLRDVVYVRIDTQINANAFDE